MKKQPFKISKNWDCTKTFDELIADAKFIFIGKDREYWIPRLVLNTPINGIDCIEIDYDNDGITNGGECVFNHEWGSIISESSKDCISFIKKFLEDDGANELINY